MLDVEKAFDVVDHDVLRLKLNAAGVKGKLWLLIDDLHTGVTGSGRWRGIFSREYPIMQGVCQGGVMSTDLFKLHLNNLLHQIQISDLGFYIGHLYIGSPTCADDMSAMMVDGHKMQAMLDICNEYSDMHHYNIHPIKSVLTLRPGMEVWKQSPQPITLHQNCQK